MASYFGAAGSSEEQAHRWPAPSAWQAVLDLVLLLLALEVWVLVEEGRPARLAIDVPRPAIQDVPDERIFRSSLAVFLRGAAGMPALLLGWCLSIELLGLGPQ